MNTEKHQALIDTILLEIEQDSFVLPTLPGVAIKLQRLIDDPNVSAEQIVAVLAIDPFVSAQIIKAANSAAFAGKPQVDTVMNAALRLGFRRLHNLVMTVTLNKMLNSANPVINKRMKQVWEHSRKVAALSYLLASHHQHLSSDQAMLAGLMHSIGILPLCMHLEAHHMPIDDELLEVLIRKCHRMIGSKLLKNWNFHPEIIEAVAEHEDCNRQSTHEPMPDYADVVMFANLQASAKAKLVNWENIPAIRRLCLSPDDCLTFIEQNADAIELVEVLLGMKQKETPDAPRQDKQASTQSVPVLALQSETKGGFWSFIKSFWK